MQMSWVSAVRRSHRVRTRSEPPADSTGEHIGEGKRRGEGARKGGREEGRRKDSTEEEIIPSCALSPFREPKTLAPCVSPRLTWLLVWPAIPSNSVKTKLAGAQRPLSDPVVLRGTWCKPCDVLKEPRDLGTWALRVQVGSATGDVFSVTSSCG